VDVSPDVASPGAVPAPGLGVSGLLPPASAQPLDLAALIDGQRKRRAADAGLLDAGPAASFAPDRRDQMLPPGIAPAVPPPDVQQAAWAQAARAQPSRALHPPTAVFGCAQMQNPDPPELIDAAMRREVAVAPPHAYPVTNPGERIMTMQYPFGPFPYDAYYPCGRLAWAAPDFLPTGVDFMDPWGNVLRNHIATDGSNPALTRGWVPCLVGPELLGKGVQPRIPPSEALKVS
jgi:hypothetical protein